MINFDDWWVTQCKASDVTKRWCGTDRKTCLTIFNSIQAFELAENKRKEKRDMAEPVWESKVPPYSAVFGSPVTFEEIITRINDVTRARLKKVPVLTVIRGGKK